jgi:hypothetical protein
MTPSRLVGREQEMVFLQDCWREVQAGQGGLALINDEAGVGKSRLVEEFADRLRWQGVRVLWGRCYEFERVLPYQPVAEALRTILPTVTPTELADLAPWTVAEMARLVLEMAEHYPDLEAPASIRPDQEHPRLQAQPALLRAHPGKHRPPCRSVPHGRRSRHGHGRGSPGLCHLPRPRPSLCPPHAWDGGRAETGSRHAGTDLSRHAGRPGHIAPEWSAEPFSFAQDRPVEGLEVNAESLSEKSAEAAPTPVLSVTEGPPDCRAWEPGQLVFG